MQNVGRSLHREGGSGAPGVQSAVKVLVEIQKYINIVFLKDVELAASFGVGGVICSRELVSCFVVC